MSSLEQAIGEFEPTSVQVAVHKADDQREETLRRYPRELWPEMELTQYAQGQEGVPENFCTWIERRTPEMGSIRGGSAAKLIIFKRRNAPGWYFPPEYEDESAAWVSVREGFVSAFELAEAGEWEKIDEIEPLHRGPALRVKTLYAYFPDELLPVCSTEHLKHFLEIVGVRDVEIEGLGAVSLNRLLLERLHAHPGLSDLNTKQLERFLYRSFSPFAGEMYKIGTGENAELWPGFLRNEVACVGWDGVGDLLQYETEEAFLAAFEDCYGGEYSRRSKLMEKAHELWSLIDTAPGDLIVANSGTSKVLGVGRVLPPGYEWDDGRDAFRHTVRVQWDERYAGEITPQGHWTFKTVKKVGSQLREEILGLAGGTSPAPESSADPVFTKIEALLGRHGQAILYGPPGTGKTYIASRFAGWWLKGRNGHEPAMTGEEAPPPGITDKAWIVAINAKKGFEWTDLEESGSQQFDRGRPERNFDEVAVGDLVIGYTATPKKQVEALARVTSIHQTEKGRSFALAPVRMVENGPTWAELKADTVLGQCQAVKNNMYGTLFALSGEETAALLGRISDQDESVADIADSLLAVVSSPEEDRELEWITFHPSFSYEDFIEGFRPELKQGDVRLELVPGVFKRLCQRAIRNPKKTYLLVVDEINRANVSKVFGELITLLEADKRERISSTLPYSKELFTIPRNVYLLGTMNTADRSIRLLDVALRRRFGFLELMPDLSLLEGSAPVELDLAELVGSLNERIRDKIGREKQVGHSYFLTGDGQPISDAYELADVLRYEVVPLLQEYSYESFEVLSELLGPVIVHSEQQELDHAVLADGQEFIQALEAHLNESEPADSDS